MKRHFLLCAAPLLLTGACATTEVNNGNEPVVQREYKTGSNIPKKKDEPGDATVYDASSLERARDAAISQPGPRTPR